MWVDLDALSSEINARKLTYDRIRGMNSFESLSFVLSVESDVWRSMADESVKLTPLLDGEAYYGGELRVPRFCRLWVYFFGDRDVSYAVLNPWDEGTTLGRRMDLWIFGPMEIWTTVVHDPVRCWCNNRQQYQQDYSE
jgi:hypothetical protein